MADYNILLGVEVNTNDLATQIRKIQTNERIDIGVRLDDREVQRQIADIRRQIQDIGNIRINLGGGGNGGNVGGRGISNFMGNINNNISQITTTANNATNTIQRLRQTLASARFDNASIDLVTQHLEQMNMAVTNVTSRIRNNNLRLNITGTDELGRTVTLLKEINLATGEITNIGKNISQSFGRTREEINRTNSAYREMKSLVKEITNTSIKINNAREAGQEFGALEIKLAALNARYDELEANFAGSFDVNQTRNLSNEWEKVAHDVNVANEAITNARNRLAETRAEMARGITGNFGKYDAEIISLENRFNSLATKPEAVRIAIDSVKQALVALKSVDGTDELIASNDRYRESLKQVEAQLKQLELTERGINRDDKFNAAKEAAIRRLSSLFSEGSAAAKKYGTYAKQLRNELESCGNIQGVQNVTRKINALGTEIKNTHIQTKTWVENIKNQLSKYSTYFSVASVIMYSVQALRSMFEQVKLIDSAMTELKKVTDETDASYSKFLSNAASRAKEIGTTIDGLVQSTADFARLGYDFKDAAGLAEVANIYAVVGDEIEGVEQATESLISTMAAFKDEAANMSNSDFAMNIIDKFNEIGNNFAISSGGIGEALKRSASSLDAANNTIDESIALITAANTVVQNPDKVGNAFKTISMRIRGAKTE